jgi:hemoglobin
MGEASLYERIGDIFAIAAVIDDLSDRLVRNQTIVDANPELHRWHTVTYKTRLPGLKWGRTWWVAQMAGGPYLYSGKGMRDAHFGLKISREIFDVVSGELLNAMDDFNVPEREKGEVLAAFGAEKGESPPAPSPGPSTGAPGIRRNPDSQVHRGTPSVGAEGPGRWKETPASSLDTDLASVSRPGGS